MHLHCLIPAESYFEWLRSSNAVLAMAGIWNHPATAGESPTFAVLTTEPNPQAIAAVKADKTKALDMFNKGEGGFRDRDLYPFCGNATDGTILAVFNPAA
jgi:hypothetical protein